MRAHGGHPHVIDTRYINMTNTMKHVYFLAECHDMIANCVFIAA